MCLTWDDMKRNNTHRSEAFIVLLMLYLISFPLTADLSNGEGGQKESEDANSPFHKQEPWA